MERFANGWELNPPAAEGCTDFPFHPRRGGGNAIQQVEFEFRNMRTVEEKVFARDAEFRGDSLDGEHRVPF